MRKIMVLSALLGLAGCRSQEPPESGAAPSKREADSAIGASGLPGARGITRAMTASDSVAARNARMDSLAAEP